MFNVPYQKLYAGQRAQPMQKPNAADTELASSKTLAIQIQPDGWARGEREGYGEPCDVTSLSLIK